MIHNCQVDIYRLTGDETGKAYQPKYSSCMVLIVPASNETMALYGEAGTGPMFELMFMGTTPDLKPEDKLKVTGIGNSGYEIDTEFIVKGQPRSMNLLGKIHVQGVAVQV